MIDKFWGEYRFLSNFYPAPIFFEGIIYPTSEHAYQAAKTLDSVKKQIIAACVTPGKAKRLGNSLELRTDWEKVKVELMTQIVEKKFTREYLKRKLINTSPEELIEGNTWNDTFWGVCKGKGENHLGKILMALRKKLVLEENN